MFQTLEIRWFGDRPLEDGERRWYESIAGESFRRSEERSDRYVALPGVTDLGLKFRGGQGVDLKARLEQIGTVELRLAEGLIASGQAESWGKWSYYGPEYMPLGGILGRLDTIEVRKHRWQYVFGLPPGEPAEPLDLALDPYPDAERGMALELAEIECDGRTVWTLGLEAFPGAPDLGSDMLKASLPLLRGCPLELTARTSSGYPAWLASLGAS